MIGLVVEGGASRTYFSVGVMDVLMRQGIVPDYIVGASAGISNAVNYASSQPGRALEIGIKYVPDKKYSGVRHFFNPKNRSLFNIDYIFKKIPNEIVPFDYEAFKNYQGEIEAAVTNISTGRPEYLPVDPQKDGWEVLVASCSLPIMFPIAKIGSSKYMDGGITDSMPYMRAIEKGCDKIIVILTRERNYMKNNSKDAKIAGRFFGKYPNFQKALYVRSDMYNEQRNKLWELENQGKAVVLCPKDTKGWKRTENRADMIKKMYDEGYNTAKEQTDKIKKYIGCDI